MKKYRINIKAQSFEFTNIENARQKVRELFGAGLWLLDLDQIEEEKEEIAPIDSEEGIEQRDQAREKMLKKAEKEEKLKNSVQRIKPIMIDPKIKRMAETKPGKRFRRTKAEMVADEEQTKEESVPKKRPKLFPAEIDEFIGLNWQDNKDRDLVELIEKKFKRKYKIDQVKAHRRDAGWVSSKPGRKPLKKKIDKPKEKKKMGRSKIYTDEVLQFLRDNINNFSNKELCEELESRFNLKTNSNNLNGILSQRGIKRDYQKEEVDPDVEEFIMKSREEDAYLLRDEIIEKFGKSFATRKIINIMNKRLEPEVDEIEAKRRKQSSDPFDDEVDDLDLDD